MDTFDASKVATHLAAGLNINTDQVAFKVAAGSVRVEVTISFMNAPESADSVQSELSEVVSNSSRVLAIFGLPLESVDRMPVVSHHKLLLVKALAPSPSPLLFTSTGKTALAASSDGIPLPLFATLLGVSGVSGVLIFAVSCWWIRVYCRHRHRRHHHKEQPDASATREPTDAAEGKGNIRPGLGDALDWPDLVPVGAMGAKPVLSERKSSVFRRASALAVFSSGKFSERKSSVFASRRASALAQGERSYAEKSRLEFSQLDKAERRRIRKAELNEGDEYYSGATGTKDAPGKLSRFRRTSGPHAGTPPPPRPHSLTAASPPQPPHHSLVTTSPPQPRHHSLTASVLPPPSSCHSLTVRPTVTSLPPPPHRQRLVSTKPLPESRDVSRYDASRYGCDAGPANGQKPTIFYI